MLILFDGAQVRAHSWTLVLDFFSRDTQAQQEAGAEELYVRSGPPDERLADSRSELCISVRSLTVTLVRQDGGEIARANVSGVRVKKMNNLSDGTSDMDGRLGSMSVLDLTAHGRLYRERFQTLGERALHFSYGTKLPLDRNDVCSHLRFEMATVLYVHTRRFVLELQTFFNDFAGGPKIRKKEPVKTIKMCLEVQAGAPLILLPVSSSSCELLVADLGRLTVTNTFKEYAGCPLDVMSVELLDMDLYTASRFPLGDTGSPEQGLRLGGGALVRRVGKSLLDNKCRLLLTAERNLSDGECLSVPGLSIRGDLSTLQGTLELAQYRLIRGLLAHNIGENVDDVQVSECSPESVETDAPRCTATLLQLGLQNVTVRLCENGGEPLATVHFISSKLTVENFSDGAQDVDLLSQEIVLVDTRKGGSNVFTDILRPGGSDTSGLEIHSRRRSDHSEFTVLLNNMHVVAVPDWWQSAREYIFIPPLESGSQSEQLAQVEHPHVHPSRQDVPYELKLNVTNSEIVVVQDTARMDTNALTLRSTTVVSWRPNTARPLSCNLNHCELFSCVPGNEQDTALSIIDPVTIGVELNDSGSLEIQVQQQLTIRLSYHDCLMLAEMAKSVPRQTKQGRERSNSIDTPDEDMIRRLSGLGFSTEDCLAAMEHCNGQLEDAALWLTQNAIHDRQKELEHDSSALNKVIVRASCFVLTVIDDCGDADVPLAELCLAELNAEQPLDEETEGSLECRLSCDYYNRALSGWEPCLEPWKCRIAWEVRRRLFVNVSSDDLLDMNITKALLELYRLVSDNWSRDMSDNSGEQVGAFRQRRRFVPFALRNETGSELSFTTAVSSRLEDEFGENGGGGAEVADKQWFSVPAGDTVPFEFGDARTGKRRHGDTHRARLHRVLVRVYGRDGLQEQCAHVSVDRVGVFFRDVGGVRLVFEVRLEGSARKLVTVRSALVLVNRLPDALDVRLGACAELHVQSGQTVAVPLEHARQVLRVRPAEQQPPLAYCQPEIDWRDVQQRAGERRQETRCCTAARSKPYHLVAELLCEHTPEPASEQLPAHTITVLPALLLVNLLPHDLHYSVRSERDGAMGEGHVAPGQERAVPTAGEEGLELAARLEGFRCRAPLTLPAADMHCRLQLEDSSGRRLQLHADITARGPTAGLRVSVSAPYWIVNRTGLPLVFRYVTRTYVRGRDDGGANSLIGVSSPLVLCNLGGVIFYVSPLGIH